MMYGPPEDVDGQCNARLFLGDDFGDGTTTMRCPLAFGHEGPHQELFHRETSGQVMVTWERDERYTCPKHGLQGDSSCTPCFDEPFECPVHGLQETFFCALCEVDGPAN